MLLLSYCAAMIYIIYIINLNKKMGFISNFKCFLFFEYKLMILRDINDNKCRNNVSFIFDDNLIYGYTIFCY